MLMIAIGAALFVLWPESRPVILGLGLLALIGMIRTVGSPEVGATSAPRGSTVPASSSPPDAPLLTARSRRTDVEEIARQRARAHAQRIALSSHSKVRRLLEEIPRDEEELTGRIVFGGMPFWPADELTADTDPPWPDALNGLRDAYTLTYFKTFHARLNARLEESRLDRRHYQDRVEMGRRAAASMSARARRKALAKATSWQDDELSDVEPYERGWLIGLREALIALDASGGVQEAARGAS